MILGAHVTKAPDPVSMHRDTVPPALQRIIMKCLEKRPADRWQTAEELLPQLEGMTTPSGGTTPTDTQPVISSGTEAAIRRMQPTRVAGLFGLAAIGALAIVYRLVILLGLPYWVFYGAIGLLGIGLPVMLATGHHERRRVLEKTSDTAPAFFEVGMSRWFTWKKSLIGGALAFVGLLIVTSAFVGMRTMGIGPAATLISSGALEEQGRLVLAEFEDGNGDSVLASAVTDLIRVDLDQSPVVRLLQPGELQMALRRMSLDRNTPVDIELASEIAEREGVEAVVAGEINVVGGAYVVSTQVLTPENGETLLTLRETARDSTGIIDAVDRLSKELREQLGESLRSVRSSPPLAQVRTSSLPALRKYTQGLQAVRRFDRRQGVALYREAIAIDTMFGAAYSSLAMELRNQGLDRPGQIEAFTTARRLHDRMSESERLYLDQAYYYAIGYQPRRVIEIAQRHLALDSTNTTTLSFLGWAYRDLREYDQAERYYRRALAVDSTLGNEHVQLINTLFFGGRENETREAIDAFERMAPDDFRVSFVRAYSQYIQNNYRGAVELMLRERDARPENANVQISTSALLEEIANVRGQLVESDQHATNSDGARRNGMSVAEIEIRRVNRDALLNLVVRGHGPDSALARMDSLTGDLLGAINTLDRPYVDLALAYAMGGAATKARAMLDAFGASVPSGSPTLAQRNMQHRAEGWIALTEDRASDAIRAFQAADRGSCVVCILPELARAFDVSGQLDSAIAIYDRFLSTGVRVLAVDALYRAPSHRRLAELYVARGDTTKAVEHYDAFVDLWENADSELQPQVQEVRRRIAQLVGEAPR